MKRLFFLLPLLVASCATPPRTPEEHAVQAAAEATAAASVALTEVVAANLDKLKLTRGDLVRMTKALAKAQPGKPVPVTLKSGLKSECLPGECAVVFAVDSPPGKNIKIEMKEPAKLHLKADNVRQLGAAMNEARLKGSPQPAGDAYLCTPSECLPQIPGKSPAKKR